MDLYEAHAEIAKLRKIIEEHEEEMERMEDEKYYTAIQADELNSI